MNNRELCDWINERKNRVPFQWYDFSIGFFVGWFVACLVVLTLAH